MSFDYDELNRLTKAYESLTKEDLLSLIGKLKKENKKLDEMNNKLIAESYYIADLIAENNKLRKELIEAYRSRGSMYWGGEKDWIVNRIKELEGE